MNGFEKARREYEAVPVPEELAQRVQAGIRQGRAVRIRRRWIAAAACLVLVLGTLNLSPTVAAAAAEVPVLGGLFQILTVREFRDHGGDRTVEVRQPGLMGTDYAQAVDAEIRKRVEQSLARGEQMVAEYKEAFLATGGTLAEWEAQDNRVTVDHEIKYQAEDRVSFVVESAVNIANAYREQTYYNLDLATGREDNRVTVDHEIKYQAEDRVSFVVESAVNIANAYREQTYYNLDLATGRELTLEDLLGADWKEQCDQSIRTQMAADPAAYFDAAAGGFETVDTDTDFYIGADGIPVVVFPPYTVAPGAMGTVEFPIS